MAISSPIERHHSNAEVVRVVFLVSAPGAKMLLEETPFID
jgi:hypothetical protein